MAAFARVVVDVRHSDVDRLFDYRIPQDMQIAVGTRVLAPFGAGNKLIEGFVVGLEEQTQVPLEKIKELARRFEEEECLLPVQVELAFWMKQKYGCLLCEALSVMMPAPMRGGKVSAKKAQTAVYNLEPQLYEAALQSLKRAPVQGAILQLLSEAGEMGVADLEQLYASARSAVAQLAAKGFAQIVEREINRRPYEAQDGGNDGAVPVELTDDQCGVCAEIEGAISQGNDHFLLHGITGSGKTEVYLRAIAHCLKLGKSAVLLVPEISLTPQMIQQFRSRLEEVAVLHSRLSPGERFDEWRRIRRGDAKVVVGARSAVFAPLEKLGLVIIDEEQESAYRSESAPRYVTEEVARRRCKQQGAVLLLGSATPSVETYFWAKRGRYRLLELPERINGEALPPVSLVDMRQEIERGNRSIFSGALLSRMQQALSAGEQVILFINRRGYSTFMMCRGCGLVFKCENCDVSLTYHKKRNTLLCHYCNSEWPIPKACPSCGKSYLKHFGVATEQVEEQVNKLFPEVRTLRMDYDTTRGKDSHFVLFEKFSRKEAQVLIGTQMIAKGFDFPMVTLVGVVAADATLFLPDYRSVERSFQLITQVAGRAGRDVLPGSVVVQTFSPRHPALRFAARHDYHGFYRYEIARRRQGFFPPFGVFLRFLFSGEQSDAVKEACSALYERVRDYLSAELGGHFEDYVLTLTRSWAPIAKISGHSRFQVLLKMKRFSGDGAVHAALFALAREQENQGVYCIAEKNPNNMY
ncbi:MAG: replication restart helicase PriA [Christensenellales bacterium]|jgi:primosomal protein N' (replication factor Y)